MIHWICHSPSPYNAELFRALAKRYPGDFSVHFQTAGTAVHPWDVTFRDGFASDTWSASVRRVARTIADVVGPHSRLVVSGSWRGPGALALLGACILRRRRFVLWLDTPDDSTDRRWWKAVPRALILRWLFRHAFRVLGMSPDGLSVLQRMGCPAEKLLELPYVIDTAAYPRAVRRESGSFRVCSVGRLERLKGFDLAIRAVERLLSQGHDIAYDIAGAGPQEAELRAMIYDRGLADRVSLTGWLQPAAVKRFLASHHVLLHSALREPYGVVVVEAMACGLPVVGTTSTSAVLHRVREGETGFQCEATAESIEAALHRAIAAVDVWDQMSAAAREEARRWSPQRACDVVSELVSAR